MGYGGWEVMTGVRSSTSCRKGLQDGKFQRQILFAGAGPHKGKCCQTINTRGSPEISGNR